MLNKDDLVNLGILEYLYNKKITTKKEYIHTKEILIKKIESKLRG